MHCTTLNSVSARTEYCRQARRIRASFAKSPFLRQHALGQLASQRNYQIRSTSVSIAQASARPSAINAIERGFTEHAANRLHPFGYTFSDRVDLLNSAQKLGMNRFRANMILALHEHRVRQSSPPTQTCVAGRSQPSFLIVLAVEILIVGLITWVCI